MMGNEEKEEKVERGSWRFGDEWHTSTAFVFQATHWTLIDISRQNT
jgi:hypothetical protein